MVRLVEFRIILPMTVEEYQVAQLYSVAEASKNQTGGGDGIEVKVNEPFDESSIPSMQPIRPEFKLNKSSPTPLRPGHTTGQYTYKIYHLEKKVPGWLAMLAPKGSLRFEEKAWNAYPYCRTIIDNPLYMNENFYVMIETMHCDDAGEQENVHNLSPELLKERHIEYIDIANNDRILGTSDYKADEDPTKFKSEKTGRGPLHPKWVDEYKQRKPVMCCYKLVSLVFKWRGLQARIEDFIMKQERRIFTNFHRQVFCWMDRWHGLTMVDIRALEEKTKQELDKARAEGQLRGMSAKDEK